MRLLLVLSLLATPLSTAGAQPVRSCKPLPGIEIEWKPGGAPLPGTVLATELRITARPGVAPSGIAFRVPEAVELLGTLPTGADLPGPGETAVFSIPLRVPRDRTFPEVRVTATAGGTSFEVGADLRLEKREKRGREIPGRGQTVYLDSSLPVVSDDLHSPESPLAPQSLTGRVLYRDRIQDGGGFVYVNDSFNPLVPVKYANLELLRNGGVDQTGFTQSDGTFSFTIPATGDDWQIRVIASNTNHSPGNHSVRYSSSNQTIYSYTSDPIQAPSGSGDFGDFALEPGNGGEVFNIFDRILDAGFALGELTGSFPANTFRAYWNDVDSPGTYYSGQAIQLGVDEGWDDSVILHEYGHFVDDLHWDTYQPGGTHYVSDSEQDPRLSFGEGFASFWQCLVKTRDGDPYPSWYIDTSGIPGGTSFSYNCEGLPYGVTGLASEVGVQGCLYDIIDGPADPDDGSPGTDDDSLERPLQEVWDTLTGQVIAGEFYVTLENFWDGWFAPDVANGYFPEMLSAFRNRGVDLAEDAYEPEPPEGTILGYDGAVQHHTFYGAGDSDLFRMVLPAGAQISVETSNIHGWGDTRIVVQGPVGNVQVSTSNDDKGPDLLDMQDVGSQVDFAAPETGAYEITVTRVFKNRSTYVDYGAYDIAATTGSVFDPDAPKIALHAKTHVTKVTQVCSTQDPNTLGIPCSGYTTSWPVAQSADVYLVVGQAPVAPGISGLSCGIAYDEVPGQGVDVFGWTLCADLDFPNAGPNGVWPASEGGNRITWVASTNCQRTQVGSDLGHAVAGAFYVYAYGDDAFSVDLNRNLASPPELKVADCDAAEIDIAFTAAGFVAFGAEGGCTPCAGECGVVIDETPACPLPDGILNTPYTPVSFTQSGGFPPLVWTGTGLPPGLSVDPSTGELGGTPAATGSYAFFITAEDGRGSIDVRECSLNVNENALAADPPAATPSLVLAGASPNPFRGSTAIAFRTPAAGPVRLLVFDAAGRRVRTLLDGFLDAGEHVERWDGRLDDGRPAPGGIYFTRLVTGEGTRAGKLVLVGGGR